MPSAGKINLGLSQEETEQMVWRKWCFGSSAMTEQPHARNMWTGGRYIHFKDLTCQIRNWCGETLPAERTAVIVRTTCESESTVTIWLWESIRRGWVQLLYHSLNNMFWKIHYHTQVKWLDFEVLFLPAVDGIYNFKKNTKVLLYSVIWMCNLSLHTYVDSFTCLYFYMQSNQTIIEYDFLTVLCIHCIMGAEILHDQVKQMTYRHYWMSSYRRDGVRMMWGREIPWQHYPLIK